MAKASPRIIETKPLNISNNMLVLESRYVFDAALATELHNLVQHVETVSDAGAAPVDHTGDAIVAASRDIGGLGETERQTYGVAIDHLVAAHNLTPSNHEIAFIDGGLADLDVLVASVPQGTHIVIVDPTRDGVAQMVEALKGEQGITGIHIISHGSEGSIELGNSSLNATTMSTVYRNALASIGANLTEGADILVYGCDFGAGVHGASAAALLADLTGADVAASTDLTGAANQGGNWVLESKTGVVDTGAIHADNWNHELLILDATDGFGSTTKDVTLNGSVGGLVTSDDPGTPPEYFLVDGSGNYVPIGVSFATAHGTVTITDKMTGAYTYVPNSNYFGTDSFVFVGTALDDQGNPVEATAVEHITVDNTTITVANEADAVTYQQNFVGTLADNVTANPSGQALTYSITTPPQHGTITSFNPATGAFTYHPDNGYSGGDIFFFQASDGSSTPGDGHVDLTVSPPPLVGWWYGTALSPGSTVTIPVSWQSSDSMSGAVVSFVVDPANPPLHGTFVNNGNGTYNYVADAGYTGSDSFQLLLTDQFGNTGVATTYINATGSGHGTPSTGDHNYYIVADTNVNSGFSTYEIPYGGTNPVLDVTSVSQPAPGTGTVVFDNANNTYTYTPPAGWTGTTSFTFTVQDNFGQTVVGTETIHVYAPPLSTAGLVKFGPVGAPINFNLDAQSVHTTTDPFVTANLNYTITQQPAHGTLTVNASTGAVVYTPNVGWSGVDTFSYDVFDGFNHVQGTDTVVSPNHIYAGTKLTYVPTGTTTGGTTSTLSGTPNGTPNWVMTRGALHGSATLNSDGTYNYQATPGFTGLDSVKYRISNGLGNTATNYLYFYTSSPATPGNNPPVATFIPDQVNLDSSSPSLDMSNFFSDPDASQTLSYYAGGLPTGLSIDVGTGIISGTVDPSASQEVINGVHEVTIIVDDGNGGVVQKVFNWTISNPTPIAQTETITTPYLTPVVVDLLNNDSDPDGDALTVTGATVSASEGSVSFDGTNWVFSPAAGFSGTATISYDIVDADGAVASSTHLVTVGNALPYLVDPDLTTGTPFINTSDASNLIVPAVDNVVKLVDLDSYFSDPNTTDTLTFTPNLTGLPSWVTYNSTTHELGGTPPSDNAGPVVVPVDVMDSRGGIYHSTVTFVPVNPGPTANTANTNGTFNTAVTVDLKGNDTDPDNDPLTVISATMANSTQGSVALVSGVWTFTPAPGFSGVATINYTIQDQDGAQSSSTHTVTIPNQVPVLADPDPTPGTPTVSGTVLTVPAVDNVPMTVDLDTYVKDANTSDTLVFTPNMTGIPTWVIWDNVNHTFSGTPPVDNSGLPINIPVHVDDGKGGILNITVSIPVTNPPPVAVIDYSSTPFNTPVVVNLIGVGNDYDPDGDPLTVQTASLANPASGTLVNVAGVWTFTPATTFHGVAVINYTIVDQDGATASATHEVTVGNAVPVLVDVDLTVGTPSINPSDPSNLIVPAIDNVLVGVDLDTYFLDGNGDPMTFTPIMTGAPSWVTYNPTTHVLGGIPPKDNVGPVTIAVNVTDGFGGSYFASITIVPVNPGPTAVFDVSSTGYMQPHTVPLTANDTDPDFDPLTVTVATVPAAQGTMSQVGNAWVFTPAVGFSGVATISYTVQDQDGLTSSSTHQVTVANAPPTLVDPDLTSGTPFVTGTNLTLPAVDNVSTSIDLDTYFVDANGDTLSFAPDMTNVPTWVVYDNVNHTFSGTPPKDNVGNVVIPVVVSDGKGGVYNATVTIAPVNPGPDALNDSISTGYMAPVVVDLLGNDQDPDNDPLTVVGTPTLTNPANGTLAYNGTMWVFTPAYGFYGTATINYTMQDQDGATDSAQHFVTVSRPILLATDDAWATPKNTPMNGNAALGDTFASGSVFAATSIPHNGTVVMNADGTFRYTPKIGFVGVDSFTYRITDPTGNVITKTETIRVSAPNRVCVTAFGLKKR